MFAICPSLLIWWLLTCCIQSFTYLLNSRIPVIFYDGKLFFFLGVFTPSDDLAKEVIAASEVSGEKLWRMPMEESYWESMKSGLADMVNTGGRSGGAITAALFSKQVCDWSILILLMKYVLL